MSHTIGTHFSVRNLRPRAQSWLVLMAALGAASALTVAAAADNAVVPAMSVAPPAAQWVERKLDYTYMGFTAKFSCDGLRDNVRDVLLALGARKQDLKIQSRGCTRLEGAEPFPGVSAQFSVLVPVTPDEIGKVGSASASATQWKTVDLVKLNRSGRDTAPCELLEQLKVKALPLFTSRNLKFNSSCVPHEEHLGEIQFAVDVLQAVPAAPAVGAAPAPAA
ncbi:MAG: hypothetical protein WDM77_20430 [Steroidobacteraceae bacterium]